MSDALDHRHLARCSDDLRAATAAVEAWGRARWPGSRVIHELNVGVSRLDIAFVQPDHVAGVEIKSDRDTLERLDAQVRDYLREIPEVWVAVAPKWQSELANIPRKVGRIVVDNGTVTDQITVGSYTWRMPAEVDAALTVQMMHLLWRAELSDIGHRFGVRIPSRLPIGPAIGLLARKMTGDQIVAAVCSALRARPFRFAADPPLAWPCAHDGAAA